MIGAEDKLTRHHKAEVGQFKNWVDFILQLENYKYSHRNLIISLTEKSTDEENPQRHIDDRGGDVDEPVGEEGGYPQEDYVIN